LFLQAADGPVDGEPLYGDASEHNGWWQKSFDIAAESANTVSDVCTLLSSHGIILTHPFAGFAAVAAGTVHCHLRFWPQSGTLHSNASHYFNQDIEILNGLRKICACIPFPFPFLSFPLTLSSPRRPHRRTLV
jgi:hypothetical protein